MKKFATVGICAIILLGTAMPVSAKGGGGGSSGGTAGGGGCGRAGGHAGGAGPVGFANGRTASGGTYYCQPGVCQSTSQR
jgi:hypothetical protein